MKIALAQLCATNDLRGNLNKALAQLEQAHALGAKLIAFPESFLYIGQRPTEYPAIAEPLEGPLVRRFRVEAAEKGMDVLLGGFCEKNPADPKKTYNTAIWINSQGELVAQYRKIHLFDSLLEGVNLQESATVSAGKEIVSFEHPFFEQVGLTICYDLRFPVLFQKLRAAGAKVIFVPAAFTAQTGAAHWKPLLQARAIENQVFIIAPGQTGQHNQKRESYGHSLVIDPWGKVIAEGGRGEGLITAEIDLEQIEKLRLKMPVFTHRVPSIDYE